MERHEANKRGIVQDPQANLDDSTYETDSNDSETFPTLNDWREEEERGVTDVDDRGVIGDDDDSDHGADYDDEVRDPDFQITESDTDDDLHFSDDVMDINTSLTNDDPSSTATSLSLPSSSLLLDSTAKAVEVEKPGFTVSSVSSGTWAKKHACVFCKKKYSKISRHFEDMHADERDVAQALSLPKRSQARNKIWLRLRNLGDYNYNTKVFEQEEGEMIPCKRPADDSADASVYIPCSHCKGMFQKNALWRHVKRCKLRSPNKNGKDHQRQGMLLIPVPQHVSDTYKTNILGTLAAGKIRQVVSKDDLILKFGQKRFAKCLHQPHQHQNVRQQVRELGRFLIKLRDQTTCQNLQDCIDPQRFNDVVDTVRALCGFQESLGVFATPTLAQRIGQALLKCANIVKSTALKLGDSNLKTKAEGFIHLYESEWTSEIGTFALNTIQVRRFNKPKAMPLARDIRKLNVYLAKEAKIEYDQLQKSPDSAVAWKRLNELTLAQIVLFNRRRGGEAERAEVTQFLKGTEKNETQEDLLTGLSDVERHLVSVLDRFELRGKRGRRVAVLMTSDLKNQVDVLLKCRAAVGVKENNIFLFPRTDNARTPLRSCDVIRKFAKACGSEHPEWITSTSLRKHIATMSQLLNLKRHELDALANFMGHSISVHREFYRLPETTMQLAKLSKILLTMEAGNVASLRGKSLDDIPMNEGRSSLVVMLRKKTKVNPREKHHAVIKAKKKEETK